MNKQPEVGTYVIYKFDRKIVGGTTEERLGRDPKVVKVEGVEVEARAIVLRVHEEDSTVDLEVLSKGGCYTFSHVANGMGERQWRFVPEPAVPAAAGPTPATAPKPVVPAAAAPKPAK